MLCSQIFQIQRINNPEEQTVDSDNIVQDDAVHFEVT
jgi:hypothetical protein